MAIPNPFALLLLYTNNSNGISMKFRGNPGNPHGGHLEAK